MKKLLFLLFLVIFSLALPTQASASVCLNPHLAYQKQQVGKKIVKRFLKKKVKPMGECPAISLWGMLLILFLCASLGGILGIILWLLFAGSWQFWLLMGAISGIIVAISILWSTIFYKP